MDDAGARGTHESRLGFSHGGGGRSPVAGGDRLFDLAHRTAHAGAPRLVDHGAAGDLAGGLLGGLGISHGVSDVDLSKTWTCRAVYLEEAQAKRLTPWVGLIGGWGGRVNAGLFFSIIYFTTARTNACVVRACDEQAFKARWRARLEAIARGRRGYSPDD